MKHETTEDTEDTEVTEKNIEVKSNETQIFTDAHR